MKTITLNIDDKVYNDLVRTLAVKVMNEEAGGDMLWQFVNRIRKAVDEERLSVLTIEYKNKGNE
jgi:hypothetical protein